mgnify:CR=1 FL=1
MNDVEETKKTGFKIKTVSRAGLCYAYLLIMAGAVLLVALSYLAVWEAVALPSKNGGGLPSAQMCYIKYFAWICVFAYPLVIAATLVQIIRNKIGVCSIAVNVFFAIFLPLISCYLSIVFIFVSMTNSLNILILRRDAAVIESSCDVEALCVHDWTKIEIPSSKPSVFAEFSEESV